MGIQFGANNAANITIDPGMIRDALLSLPDAERRFIITEPAAGEHKVYGIHAEKINGKYKQIWLQEENAEP